MEKTYVYYRDFGAVGDGKTDDMEAIVRAHAYANEHGLPVRADAGAHYYIGGRDLTAVIKTDTDWGDAHFTLDDRELENRNQSVFSIPTSYEQFPVELASLSKDATKVPLTFDTEVLLFVKDADCKVFRRFGVNASNGVPKIDTVLVAPDGTVKNGINWDFDHITEASAIGVDAEPLTVRGGFFTTIANAQECFYNYHCRNIRITRSRVTVEGLTHRVTDEGEQGAPYAGFFNADGCAYLHLRDCSLTGHKLYWTPGQGGMSPMGTYDISLGSCCYVTLTRVTQVPDIMDSSRWGLMGSNFCKDIHLVDCKMSRFDAHMGVNCAAIKGSSLGWQCVQAIGRGLFAVEDSTVFGRSLVSLRYDYGGHWDGDFIVKNCTWRPNGHHPAVISGANGEHHDFGYPCKMPRVITVEDLLIDDSDCPEAEEICLLNNYKDDLAAPRPYPYQTPERLVVRNVRTVSGKPVKVCRDPAYYPGLVVEWDGKIL